MSLLRPLFDSARLRPLIDRVAAHCGYVPEQLVAEAMRIEGHVYVRWEGDEDEIYLGENVITEKMRINAAGLLARPPGDWGFGPPAYLGTASGYSSAVDNRFPTKLAVGTGTTAAASSQFTMDTPLYVAGAVAYYPLQSVRFHDTVGGYPAGIPISCSYYFDIPAGESYDGGIGTDVDFQEWALFGPAGGSPLPAMSDPVSDEDMLARKVARLSKLSGLDLTVRWEIRT